jgi:predicted Rossmann-fold nucleotide-binding protein
MKVAVIGGSSLAPDLTDGQQGACRAFGGWLVQQGHELLTGACGGYPYLVVQGFAAAGGESVGYSPAADADEDQRVFHHPPDVCGRYKFLGATDQSNAARLLMRSVPLVDDADAVVSIAGNWGTLMEQAAAVVCGKPLVVLEPSGGASALLRQLYPALQAQNVNNYGGQVFYAQTFAEVQGFLAAL